MSRRLIAVLALLASTPALAQRGPCGGFFSSPFVPQPDDAVVVVHPGTTVAVPGNGFQGGGAASLGSLNDSYLFLAVVVVAAAALPLVLYAVDTEAPADVMRCWEAPYQYLQTYGGALATTAGATGYLGLRGGASIGAFGFDVSAETAPYAFYDVMGALSLRAPPRHHVELGLSLGYRQVVHAAAGAYQYIELALPHRYLPFRASAWDRGVGLEVRPAFLFAPAQAVDARLDVSLTVPLGPFAQLSAGGRVYSLATRVHAAAQLGLQFGL